MKFIPFLILLTACAGNSKKADTILVYPKLDSAIVQADSTYAKLEHLDTTLALTTDKLITRITQLEKEKEELKDQYSSEGTGSYMPYMLKISEKEDSNKDKTISSLLKRISILERQVIDLKKRLAYDSVLLSKRTGIKIEPKIIVPESNSLIIDFIGNTTGISVYAIPYDKKVKKLMQYEIGCDLKKLNEFGAIQSDRYNDLYFFNNLKPGKYLVKVCGYYGGFKLIDRGSENQVVRMQVSPPLQ